MPCPRQPSPLRRYLHASAPRGIDRKSTRLNSSHSQISYAVFCLKKKKKLKFHADQVALAADEPWMRIYSKANQLRCTLSVQANATWTAPQATFHKYFDSVGSVST